MGIALGGFQELNEVAYEKHSNINLGPYKHSAFMNDKYFRFFLWYRFSIEDCSYLKLIRQWKKTVITIYLNLRWTFKLFTLGETICFVPLKTSICRDFVHYRQHLLEKLRNRICNRTFLYILAWLLLVNKSLLQKACFETQFSICESN